MVAKKKITDDLLKLGSRNRSGKRLRSKTAAVIHWVLSPGARAKNVATFIRNRLDFGSYNFIICLDGKIIRKIPSGEVSFHAGTWGRSGPNGMFPNNANEHTVSIGMCHDDLSGEYTNAQKKSLIWLLGHLRTEGYRFLLTHFDITGKKCDTYYRTHTEELKALAEAAGYERPELKTA